MSACCRPAGFAAPSIVVLSAALPSVAQNLVVSRLSGTVRDRSGLPVTAVAVTRDEPEPDWRTARSVTDQEGRYRLRALEAGEYELRMSQRWHSPRPSIRVSS